MFSFQSWLAFAELSKPFFTEHDSVEFPNSKPPKDQNNNAYCQVSKEKTKKKKKNIIDCPLFQFIINNVIIELFLCYINRQLAQILTIYTGS